ncbi:MAG: rRNA pseudouridine synthase [Hyphomicrobiales bacterium]|nr:rRNA pseudouridine synthase [Hyphomicrobiales bacterium]
MMKNTDKNTKPARKRQPLPSHNYDVAGKIDKTDSSGQKPERIAKRMARAGLCSRREAEAWINAGRVSVNGKLLDSPATTITLADRVEVDGNPLPGRERTRLWLFHKPSGVLSTNHDPEGRPTIFEQLPSHLPRMLSIGRLDMSTEGLILMTNDGGLARILELPSTGWLRRYKVRAHGKVDQVRLEGLKDGIAVDGILYGPVEAVVDREQGSNTWLTVAIREGKNREVKNVLGAIGLEVNRLIRLSYGPFQLGDLAVGEVREIRARTLRDQLGERLVSQSGADFDAPIFHPSNIEYSGSGKTKSGKNAVDAKTRRKVKPKSRQNRKISKGEMAVGTMERLTTRKGHNPEAGRGRKSGGKPFAKPNRKSK